MGRRTSVPYEDFRKDIRALGFELRKAMNDAQTTKAELAEYVGCADSTIGRWIKGENAGTVAVPDIVQLAMIEEGLGLKPGTLLKRAGWI